jgi:hypothetical protein
MQSANYMNDITVKIYYVKWELTPKLVDRYKEYFYQFVKACLRLDKKPDTEHLKNALYDSFYQKYGEKRYNEFSDEVVVLFEHLKNVSNTVLPE